MSSQEARSAAQGHDLAEELMGGSVDEIAEAQDAASAAKSPVAGEPGGAPTSPGSSAASPRTVRWIDSSLQNGQVDKDDFPKPVVITSVGFVAEETDDYVTLARDDMGDGDFRGLCSIPKLAVMP